MHIFPYSRRPGTPADKMPGQLPNTIKEARSKAAITVAEEMSVAYRQNLVDTCLPVLFEEADGEYYTGHTPNYLKVYVKASDLHNQVRDVVITGLFRDGLLGDLKKSVN
jgi:threonylcarbamoyladenosine tRNA methylthiotransferase MtaB